MKVEKKVFASVRGEETQDKKTDNKNKILQSKAFWTGVGVASGVGIGYGVSHLLKKDDDIPAG